MRLFEAIIDANHRAVAGDTEAGLHPADFADALPVIALTCIDPRLNAFFPNVLGVAGGAVHLAAQRGQHHHRAH